MTLVGIYGGLGYCLDVVLDDLQLVGGALVLVLDLGDQFGGHGVDLVLEVFVQSRHILNKQRFLLCNEIAFVFWKFCPI